MRLLHTVVYLILFLFACSALRPAYSQTTQLSDRQRDLERVFRGTAVSHALKGSVSGAVRPMTGRSAVNNKAGRVRRSASPDAALSSGWVISQVVAQGWTKDGWVNTVRNLHYHDANDYDTMTVNQGWENNAWVNVDLETWTYDENGNQIIYVDRTWDTTTNAWYAGGVRDSSSYDSLGRETSMLGQDWNGTSGTNLYLDTYTNDAQGNKTSDLYQTWSGGTWVNSLLYSAAYDSTGNMTILLCQSWLNGAWANVELGSFSFDVNGRRSVDLWQVWNNGAWVNYSQDIYTDDANEHETGDLYQKWSGGKWVNSSNASMSYDANGNESTELDQGWILNTWVNSSWVQWTWVQTSGLSITAPVQGEVVLAGSDYLIEWKAEGASALKIELSLDSGQTFRTIDASAPATPALHEWSVPETLRAKCRIRITDLSDTSHQAMSGQFRIKPYILTRFKAGGDFEKFDPLVHGWQFRNDSGTMWPEKWWKQFNYRTGTDPMTALRYDTLFKVVNSLAFPDWPLFVRVFGIANCYVSSSPVIYSERAYWYWRDNLAIWGGSCFGFSVSSLINFDYPDQFKGLYPQLGDFTALNDLAINDSTRLIVNFYMENWLGLANIQYVKTMAGKTPRETLADIKQRFTSSIQNDQSLYMADPWSPEAHSVVPYALKWGAGPGMVQVLVYDSNCPDGNCPQYGDPIVYIDSVNNTWFYPPLGWAVGTGRFYLEAPVDTFLSRPILPRTVGVGAMPTPVPARPAQVPAGNLEIFAPPGAAITIADSTGGTIGFHDSTVTNTLPGGIPIIPPTSRYQPPPGYFVPAGSYRISMSSFPDTVSRVSVFDTLSLFSYWRNDASGSQTDRLTFSNGLAVGNPDPASKRVNMEAVLTLPADERTIRIANCLMSASDSLQMSVPDSGRLKIVNLGPQKTYDLSVQIGGAGIAGKYVHTGITAPAHSTHYIQPNWPDLHLPVKILEDVGNTGSITDTLTIANQTTGVKDNPRSGLPAAYALEQNYPNPFNPTTVIRYSLPKETRVTLTVYNVLGQPVATLVDGVEHAGYGEATFAGNNLPSGVYFYRLTAGTFSETRKMLLIK